MAGRTEHGDCRTYRGCRACNRNHDAFGVVAGTFGALVLFTVMPVTVLLVLAWHGVGGTVGAWAVAGFLAALPLIVGGLSWLADDRKAQTLNAGYSQT
jgi:hypothetical protein